MVVQVEARHSWRRAPQDLPPVILGRVVGIRGGLCRVGANLNRDEAIDEADEVDEDHNFSPTELHVA